MKLDDNKCSNTQNIQLKDNKRVPQEDFEDTKWVNRIRKSKDRQHRGQKKKDKRTNNDLPNITQKTNDRVTLTSLKLGMNSGAPEELAGPVILYIQLEDKNRLIKHLHITEFQHYNTQTHTHK